MTTLSFKDLRVGLVLLLFMLTCSVARSQHESYEVEQWANLKIREVVATSLKYYEPIIENDFIRMQYALVFEYIPKERSGFEISIVILRGSTGDDTRVSWLFPVGESFRQQLEHIYKTKGCVSDEELVDVLKFTGGISNQSQCPRIDVLARRFSELQINAVPFPVLNYDSDKCELRIFAGSQKYTYELTFSRSEMEKDDCSRLMLWVRDLIHWAENRAVESHSGDTLQN